jgi:hypothetical protein
VADDSVVCYDNITTTLDKLPLESKCSCNLLFTSFLSHQVSIFTHLHSVYNSALSMHSARRFNAQVSSATSRITLGASVVCYITDITLSQWLLGWQPCCAQDSALAPDRRWGKCRKGSNTVGPHIPYDRLRTKGETCAKFGWDRFRNVDLYKVQTNKETNKNEQKAISSLYIRFA